MKEANIIRKIPPHKNIIQYMDVFFTEKEELALVMEYAQMGTLNKLIENTKIDNEFNEANIVSWLY